MQRLANWNLGKIWPVPVEVEDPIPFEQDRENASMMPNTQIGSGAFWYEQIKYSRSFVRASLANAALCIFTEFLIWQTRFSGRRAPEREGVDSITREAYSQK